MPDLLLTSRSVRREAPRSSGPTRRPRRLWRALAAALIAAGMLALLDAAVTLIWQEPFSALYATIKQDDLSGALQKIEHSVPSAVERNTLASLSDEHRRIAFLAGQEEHRLSAGDAVGRIRIPLIGASFVVVKGTDEASLQSGPGIYSETAFPGIAGTTAIAGHRTTYLAPFRHIDALRPGSRILLEMPYAHFTYTVIGQSVVAPTDVHAAVANVGYERLVLSACTPLFSAAKRLLVFARLSRTVPVGAARQLPGGATARPFGAPHKPAVRPVHPSLPAVLEPVKPNLGAPPV